MLRVELFAIGVLAAGSWLTSAYGQVFYGTLLGTVEDGAGK